MYKNLARKGNGPIKRRKLDVQKILSPPHISARPMETIDLSQSRKFHVNRSSSPSLTPPSSSRSSRDRVRR